MELRRDDLDWAATEGILTADQAARLWTALQARTGSETKAKLDVVHVLYYLGALIVIGAMGFFMTLGWEAFGGGGIFAIATGYTLVFVFVGRALWRMPGLKIPGGLLLTMAVCMTPLAMYGLERLLGIWPTDNPGTFRDFHVYVKSGWLWMELETILAGCIAIRFVRFPFLTAPIAFIGWYISMDLAPIVVGSSSADRAWVSAAVGLFMLLAGFLVDRRTRDDFAFWLYLFGMFAFWGGISTLDSGSEFARFLYLLLNVGLIALSVLLERRVFLVFGGLGTFGYLGYESWHTFQDSIAFPFALSAIGLLILFVGVKYARHRQQIDSRLNALVPGWLERRLPRARVRG